METRRRVGSGIRTIALLIVSIIFTAAIAAALLIDTLTAPAFAASAPLGCTTTVQPLQHTIEFVEGRC